MLPLVGIPETVVQFLKQYRNVFCKEAYDYVNRCWSCYQTVVTASISNGQRVDGIEVEVQYPNYEKEELAYLEMTVKDNYEQMEQVRERLVELLHYQKNRLAYRKRTEIAVDIVRQLEREGKFPHADYAFDQGVLSRPLTEVIEKSGKHWVTEMQFVGFESAQLRNEEAVKRHFCLSCVAQSILQTASCSGRKADATPRRFPPQGNAHQASERFNLTPENESTIGQRLYTLTREALHNLLEMSQNLFVQGKSTEQILEVIMPS